jgi:hypothetical protein
MPHHWTVDAPRLCFRGLFQSAGTPVMDAANNTERQKHLFTKICQDAPLLAVGMNGILVRGALGDPIPPHSLQFSGWEVPAHPDSRLT